MAVEETDSRVVLSHPSSPTTKVEILKFGAHVLSWTIEAKEQLWLSEAAKLDGSKAVRGGIPLVFPVFGKAIEGPCAALPQHGFARNSTWEFLGQTKENPPTVQFGLGPENIDPEVLAKWPGNNFTLIYTIELNAKTLKTTIDVENNDDHDWEFNWLFHTYLRIPDITDAIVTNFPGAKCYDQLVKATYEEKAPMISFHEEFDRIYKEVEEEKVTQVVQFGKVLHSIKRENLPDVVVWNPWTEKSRGMADFEPKTGWHQMLCIEPGYVGKFFNLKSGSTWTASQLISQGEDIKLQASIF